MSSTLTSVIVFSALVLAIALGGLLSRLLPQHHLVGDTKDSVKLAMGLVSTMSALVLGLLVSSAKASYDTTQGEVSQMAAKITLLDRALKLYGSEAADAREQLRELVAKAIGEIWRAEPGTLPAPQGGETLFTTVGRLTPKDDMQRSLKAEALSLTIDLGQLRAILDSQTGSSSYYNTTLTIVVAWLGIIFAGFSLVAPRNATAWTALVVSALSVSGALYLILELEHPFSGLLQIPSEPVVKALAHLAKAAT